MLVKGGTGVLVATGVKGTAEDGEVCFDVWSPVELVVVNGVEYVLWVGLPSVSKCCINCVGSVAPSALTDCIPFFMVSSCFRIVDL